MNSQMDPGAGSLCLCITREIGVTEKVLAEISNIATNPTDLSQIKACPNPADKFK